MRIADLRTNAIYNFCFQLFHSEICNPKSAMFDSDFFIFLGIIFVVREEGYEKN
jgi:hypothetical protein